MKRSHIRWWNAGLDRNSNQTKWLGAISYDDGLVRHRIRHCHHHP
ncbi:LssY C-terminal domain-containing protein [Vibrio chagasii]|nr:LssY C-terminal domain-containing protein [Vibrio chagasii]